MSTEDPPALEASGLVVSYGVVRAVQDVSLRVERRSITALVGSNGAGKSSILRTLAGSVSARAGEIRVDGVRIDSVPTKDRVLRHGIVLVPEGRSAFVTLTVRENLELGARIGRRRAAAGARSDFSLEDAYALFPVLKERAAKRAQYLSGGEQQMLAIARSMLMAPSLLLIDEPSMGLAPLLVRKIFGVLGEVLAAQEVAVLLVEQDTSVALAIAESAYVLEHGRIVLHAPAAELAVDPRLRAAYLGHADALGRRTVAAPAEAAPAEAAT